MITATALGSFALIVGLLTITPGLDTALILRTAALGHRSRAWGVVLGIQSGTLIWGVLSSLGMTTLLSASHLAYVILRWTGAAYLVWMGGRILVSALRQRTDAEPDVTETVERTNSGDTFRGGWRQGILTNLLNPKVGAFYIAALPQFIPEGSPHVTVGTLLTAVHILAGLLWSTVLIAFATALGSVLRRPSARRLLDRITGVVIVGFGIRLAIGD